MSFDPLAARLAKEAAAERVKKPPKLNAVFPFTTLSFDHEAFGVLKDPPKKDDKETTP